LTAVIALTLLVERRGCGHNCVWTVVGYGGEDDDDDDDDDDD